MTSTEIAEKLSGDPERDIEMLSAMLLAEKDRESRHTVTAMIERVSDYAHLAECGITPTGVPYTDFVLGNCLFEMPSDDLLTSLSEMRRAAEAGDAEAQYAFAMHHIVGTLGMPDYAAAVAWLQKAAEKGNAAALYELGVCYMNGEGVPHDYAAAEKCFTDAAENQNVDAMIALGTAYRGGRGLREDPVKSYAWYKKAAEAGSAAGYLHLGICTYNGSGTEANMEKAIELVRMAEKLGSRDAKMLLKRMQRYYEEGDLDADELAARN